MLKVLAEYEALRAAGISDEALEIYSDSDLYVYDNGDGTYTVKIYRENTVSEAMTIKDLEAFLTEPLA